METVPRNSRFLSLVVVERVLTKPLKSLENKQKTLKKTKEFSQQEKDQGNKNTKEKKDSRGFAKGVSRTVSPHFSESETEENGRKRKKTEENGKNRNPRKTAKKGRRMETEKRKKTEENGKKNGSETVPATPFAKSRDRA